MDKVIDIQDYGRLSEDDRYTLRHYDELRAAANYVAVALRTVPAVLRVALFGSVASSPDIELTRRGRARIHRPKDVDLAVWLDGSTDLNELRQLCARALKQLYSETAIGVAHHQVDVFLLDAAGSYTGRLCRFNECPKQKPPCLAEGCGKVPFLQQHDDFVFDTAASLDPARIRVLYERR